MKRKQKRTPLIIALGGSVIAPRGINVSLLKKIKTLIIKLSWRPGTQLIIIIGGGYIAREYQHIAKKIYKRITQKELDRLGISATKLNAELVRVTFGDSIHANVITSEKELRSAPSATLIVSGWTPGRSTDAVALRVAQLIGSKKVFIAGKPDHVYNKDFTRFKNACPYETVTWKDYRKLVPKTWKPGLPSPVDPIAARIAQKNDIDVVVLGGNDTKNLTAALIGKRFRGTRISNKTITAVARS